MPAPFWSPQHIGCVERDSFQLHPANRTALSSIGRPPTRVTKGDGAAPIIATIQTNQSFAQWTAFGQWYKNDLACGARPFFIDLWLWDVFRRVRARIVTQASSQRELHDQFVTQVTIEIERESLQ